MTKKHTKKLLGRNNDHTTGNLLDYRIFRIIIKYNSRSINEISCSVGIKYFSPMRNNSNWFSNWCRNSKRDTWFWDNNFNNVKQKTNDKKKIVQALEDSNTLFKGVTKKIKNKIKEQKGTLGLILLGNLLSGKGIVRDGYENKKGKGIVRPGYGKELDF